MSGPVLVSWIATLNDPYVRDRKTREFVHPKSGERIPGPTLQILNTDPYKGRITDAVFIRQGGPEADQHRQVYEELVEALQEHAPSLRLHPEVWEGADPTDHEAIFEFLRALLPRVRRKFRDRELLLHISPGTGSMQTVWVLMAETGFIDQPFSVVKSYRPEDRPAGAPLVVPVKLGIDSFYKRFQEARSLRSGSDEQAVGWNPAHFKSDRLQQLFSEGRRIARLKVPVLITGERGTGKTTLASWIRTWSSWNRGGQQWRTVACGQYTSETMRAELFGHVRGAFTDAKEDRAGLLKEVDGDTLFLDEVGDISHDMQRLLIKALEEKVFQPLGSAAFVKSDFRLVTATNLPMTTLAERLDADFLDRISPFVLRVPALREIPEDLGWLWDNVLAEAARRAVVLPRYALMGEEHRKRIVRKLESHPLPGNLRDLFRVAWRFLAARADDDAPMTVADASSWALAILDETTPHVGEVARVFARAFSDARPLPLQLLEEGPLDPNPLLEEQRLWFANEVARLVQSGSVLSKLTTIKERTLREWRRQKSAEKAEE